MGRSKGKGASNLRRINTQNKIERNSDELYNKLINLGLPPIDFDPAPVYVHICKELLSNAID